ncbi:MAG: Coenzyme F420 hydrogenase/dehydrogenase, beta subunit C-terminal domain [Gammaproteobacteria bacterium]|nr:Coenzyme F420 hydrogenase/dehydrogenase, beta subunit C-terminal domain [Gammaproteobacteria bacterium]
MMTSNSEIQRIVEEGLCIGCGLCASAFPEDVQMRLAPSGHLRPCESTPLNPEQNVQLKSFCPGVVHSGMPSDKISNPDNIDSTWGPIEKMVTGHSSDPKIRHKAATGGGLTAISLYLLESGQVDGILQVAGGGLKAYFGHSQLSQTREDVINGSGSVYASTSPLESLLKILDTGATIALVAKPCDISAVRLLGKNDPRIDRQIKALLTPICGGFFPPFAMENFLKSVGANESDVDSVSYRGEGCPGPTIIRFKNGETITKTYLDFWGTDSSQWYMPWRCRICPDGSGEAADIVSGDTWPNCEPTLEMMEGDLGTNVIIGRTSRGAEIINAAIKANYLNIEGDAEPRDLDYWQPHLVKKKVTAHARYSGMRSVGQIGLSTIDLRTEELTKHMDSKDYQSELDGTSRRITIGKHHDDFTSPSG